MTKKVLYLLAVTLVFTTACKKETATSKIDENAIEIAPANSEIKPEMVNQQQQQPKTPQEERALQNAMDAQKLADKRTEVSNMKVTEMTFNKVEHDFGTINQGDKVDYTFKFTNTGQNDLLISNAVGSCGCTVPEYPKEPIKPGKTGKIKVIFNSAGKSGQQTKTVTINTNTASGTEKLTIKASIVGGEKKEIAKPLQQPIQQ